MKSGETIFEKTYKSYLDQLREISFESITNRLGVKKIGNLIKIRLFEDEYLISHEKIVDKSGVIPSYDICVILSRYILLCPEILPEENEWISFKDFKDSGPLVNYFKNDVEYAIASYFSSKLDYLVLASEALSGYPPVLDVKYDYSIQFDALPRIPVIILYNDTDEGFPATCTILFERRAEKYLDAECIAMLGRHMFVCLRKTLKSKLSSPKY